LKFLSGSISLLNDVFTSHRTPLQRNVCGSFSPYLRYYFRMGFNRRAVARDEEAALRDRFTSTIVIGACIIAAVRLAREEHIDRPSPRVLCTVMDAVYLARRILDAALR
jgi:hypothetical protein